MAVTIKDVAVKAGVSHQAVSAVLNGKTNCRVANATRERILACAREMAYRPNFSARWLKSRKTGVITVVVYPWVRSENGSYFSTEFQPPFMMAEAQQQLASAIRRQGYTLKLEYAYPGSDLQKQSLEIVNPNLTDGIIFCNYQGGEFTEVLEKLQLPHLFFGYYVDSTRSDIPLLGLDIRTGLCAAIRSLVAAGRNRIAYCGVGTCRLLPLLCEELKSLELFDPARIHIVYDYYDVQRLLKQYRPEDFDAVVCSNDVMANWVYREAQCHDIDVPGTLAIVGYDNDPAYDFISTVGLDSEAFHASAAELLAGAIEQPSESLIHKVFETEFFPRQTTPKKRISRK